MNLRSLLEVARQFKDNKVKPLNEAYSSNLLSTWQNEIWSNFFAGDPTDMLVNNIKEPNAFLYLIGEQNMNGVIEKIYRNNVYKVNKLEDAAEDIKKLTMKDKVCNEKSLQAFNQVFSGQQCRLTHALPVLIKNAAFLNQRSGSTIAEKVMNLDLSAVKNEDMISVPPRKALQPDYCDHLIFWVTESNKLQAVTINGEFLCLFVRGKYCNSYSVTKKYIFNPNMPEMKSCPTIYDEFVNEYIPIEFRKWVLFNLQPWYKQVIYPTVYLGDRSIKRLLNNKKVSILQNNNALLEYGIIASKITKAYCVPIEQFDITDKLNSRKEYKKWLEEYTHEAEIRMEKFRQLIKDSKTINEYTELKNDIEYNSDMIYELQTAMLTIMQDLYMSDDILQKTDDNAYIFQFKKTYFPTVSKKCSYYIGRSMAILKDILSLDKFQNTAYAKENSDKLREIVDTIKSNSWELNCTIRDLTRYIRNWSDFSDAIYKIDPAQVNNQLLNDILQNGKLKEVKIID